MILMVSNPGDKTQSGFLFSRPIPARKNINPSILSAHGLTATKFLPKIPNTPNERLMPPSRVRIIASALVIENEFC